MSTANRFCIGARILAALTILCLVPWMGTSRLIAASEVPALQVVVGKSVRLELSPAQVLEGDPVTLRVTGLRPGAVVTIHIQSVSLDDAGQKEPFYGEATFMADASGTINLATAPPVRGYYQGADIHGLFWSQRPLAANSAGQAAITALHLDDPSSVSAHQAVLTLEEGGTVQDRRVLRFVSNDPDVMRDDVRSDGLIGVFYCKKGARKRPVVVALGGSEGGLSFADWIGPKLASRGFAVFGLNYFSPPSSAVAGVPTTLKQIPVELLEKARGWLKARPEVDIERFGVVGYSKGGEFTLVLASSYDWINAAVAYSPSDFVWQGIQYGGGTTNSSWSRAGRDLPFVPTTGTREAIAKGRQSGSKIYLAPIAKANLEAASPERLSAAAIPVERSHAALLLFGGGDDQLWDCGASVERAAARLKRAAYPYRYATVLYPGAGHDLAGTGWRPTTTDNTDPIQDGGTPEADAHAQAESWTKMLDFLNRELHP